MATYHINKDWSLEAMYQYTTNKSRSSVYDYTQNMVSMGVAWNF